MFCRQGQGSQTKSMNEQFKDVFFYVDDFLPLVYHWWSKNYKHEIDETYFPNKTFNNISVLKPQFCFKDKQKQIE